MIRTSILPFGQWLTSHQPLFGAVLETHIKEQNMNRIMASFPLGWSFVYNHLSDEDGCIVFLWRSPATVSLLHQTQQTLTLEIRLHASPPFIYTVVYASNLRAERVSLWVELIDLQNQFSLGNAPWMIGGDFNQILHHEEHSLLEVNVLDPQMLKLRDCLLQIGVFDLRYRGPQFTWSNKQPIGLIAKKIDRLLVNAAFIVKYPNCAAFFLPPLFSDHCACLIDLSHSLPTAGTKPFKFFNYLYKHPDFMNVVNSAWSRFDRAVPTLTDLCWKLKSIKVDLKTLNRENFSRIQQRVTEASVALQTMQLQSLNAPSQDFFKQEIILHEKWSFLRSIEESYFQQRSRINWLQLGDQNTAFFHRVTQLRNSYNAIRLFTMANGIIISDPLEMSDHAYHISPTFLDLFIIKDHFWFHLLIGLLPFSGFPAHQYTMQPWKLYQIVLKYRKSCLDLTQIRLRGLTV